MKKLLISAFTAALFCLSAVISSQGPSLPFGSVPQWAAGGGTFTLVQQATGANINTSPYALTIPSTTAGNTLFIDLYFTYNSGDNASGISGGCSTTWTRGGRATSAAYSRALEIWYCTSATSGATSATITWAAAGDYVRINESEFHSTATVAFDAGVGSTNLTGGATSPYLVTGPTMTTTGSGVTVAYVGSPSSCTSALLNATSVQSNALTGQGAGNFYGFGIAAGSVVFSCDLGGASATVDIVTVALK